MILLSYVQRKLPSCFALMIFYFANVPYTLTLDFSGICVRFPYWGQGALISDFRCDCSKLCQHRHVGFTALPESVETKMFIG